MNINYNKGFAKVFGINEKIKYSINMEWEGQLFYTQQEQIN